MTDQLDILQGTLDLLILKTLSLQPRHGVGVADRIAQITGGTFTVTPGSLFPALHRLEHRGWIEGEWGRSETRRKAKFYRLTAAGRRQLEREEYNWRRITTAVGQVLEEQH